MRTTITGVALAALSLGALAAAAQAPGSDAISEQSRKAALEHYQAGINDMQAASFGAAAEEFATAVKLDRLFVLAHYQLGEAQMALKNYPAAVEALEGCIAAHEEVTALQQTDHELAEKRLDEEIQALQDSLKALARPTSGAAQPGNAALRLESRLHELEQQRRRGVSPSEVPAEFNLALGSAYLREGRMEDAEKAYREAIKVNPKMGEAHNNLAFVCFRSGRLDEAASELKAARKAGFAVNPRFEDDVKKAQKEASAKQ
jgi:tetratricopeptide (TPR) repeat protein